MQARLVTAVAEIEQLADELMQQKSKVRTAECQVEQPLAPPIFSTTWVTLCE